MNPSRRFALQALACAVLGSTRHASASSDPAAGADTLPGAVRSSLDPARLHGAGTMRWFGLKIYDARLWSGRDGIDGANLFSRPFALELQYARSLAGSAIADRSGEEIARLGFGDPSSRAAWLEAMRGIFPDVTAGDRIVGLSEPGRPARFFLNGKPLGEVADPRFSTAFFSIWLDDRTVAPALRLALLGDTRTLAADEKRR
jgi:hypothetical protein